MEKEYRLIGEIRSICRQLGELEKKLVIIESTSENDLSNKELLLKEYENGVRRKIVELITYYNELYQK